MTDRSAIQLPLPLAGEGWGEGEGDLRHQCAVALREWVSRANELPKESIFRRRVPLPHLSFDLRGLNAGQFVYDKRRYGGPCIRVNADLLHEHPQRVIEEIIPHEVAHLAVWALHGRRTLPHGKEWRAVMRYFGKTPDVSHTMKVTPARRVQKFAFSCGCPGTIHQVSRTILRRRRRGVRYFCRKCGETLRPRE